MVSFLDGPAAGQSLALRRAPKLLRVVRGRGGAWDALDQLDDEPKRTEQIYVYLRQEDPKPTWIHLCMRPRSASGTYWTADYRYLPEQPADSQIRGTAAWRSWVTQQLPTLTNGVKHGS